MSTYIKYDKIKIKHLRSELMFKRAKDEIYYDEVNKTYTKLIKPRFNKKIKYFFGLRKYPGKNVKYISDLFLQNGIRTFEVIEVSKYKTVTKEITGDTLMDKIIRLKNDEEINNLIEKYIKIVVKIIELGVYYGDFNFGNFIVNNGKLYVIDLEDYRKDFFSKFRKKEMMRRLKRTLYNTEKNLENRKVKLNGEEIYLKIEEKLKNMI